MTLATERTSETFPVSATPPILEMIEPMQTPHLDPSPSGNEATIARRKESCRHQWADPDRPEINQRFAAAIKAINLDAKAWATVFAENCVDAVGHATFLGMETDFDVPWPAAHGSDFKALGNWIVQVMKVMEGCPADLSAGPEPGFVEFWFIQKDAEPAARRVLIQKYGAAASGRNGEEWFKLFHTNPYLKVTVTFNLDNLRGLSYILFSNY